MKKILIAGINSYVGTSLEKWLMRIPDKYYVESIDMKNSNWINFNFSKFDVVFYVAGIVHIKLKRKLQYLYSEVNTELVIKAATKSKESGVSHFIFMSTMSIYGLTDGIIGPFTQPDPRSLYGKSKLEAENRLIELSDKNFNLSIIRAPMIYGKNSPGNYSKLSKLSLRIFIFPNLNNKRSLIYIDNLSELIKIIIDLKLLGVYLPQNSEYASTTKIVKLIAESHKRKIIFIKWFNPIIRHIKFKLSKKLFFDLIYKKELSNFEINYNVVDFENSIKEIEEK
ncbi:MAG: NAD dependent epimerase/dehydratase family protein [Candidatus Izimaplasma bacterium HR2]|nr:MAG: NAD dependent epimerase/dehydratase family protein [Candidatus Izimaplasma bacterium HR2]